MAVNMIRACRAGNVALVVAILAAGEAADCDSGLCRAAEYGHEPVVQLLLDHGTRPSAMALREAATYGHTEVARLLLDRGSPIGPMALPRAVGAGNVEMVQLLLERGAVADTNALEIAVTCGHEDVAQQLLAGLSPVLVINLAANA